MQMKNTTYLKNNLLFALILFAIIVIPVTAQDTCIEYENTNDNPGEGVAMMNPAVVYCTELGYEHNTVQTEQVEKGIRVIPDTGEEFNECNFLNGNVRQQYSYNFQGFKIAEEIAVQQSPVDDANRTIEKSNLTHSTQVSMMDYHVYTKEGIEVEGSRNYIIVNWLGKEYLVVGNSTGIWTASRPTFE